MLSHLYSLSFEPNPHWSREYPGQEEIQDHLIGVAHKYQLYRHIRFNSSVDESRWDEQNNKWRSKIRRLGGKESEIGETYTVTSDFLVSAVGQLNTPKYPDVAGLDTFQGKTMHSARWDWDYDLRGKKVGILGTGATAAQIIPEIAPLCDSLTVFQRTPAWVMPRHDAPISATWQSIYKYVPFVRKRYRARLMDFREYVFDAAFDPNSSKHNLITSVSTQHMLAQLPGDENAELRERLTPNYPFSCKRIIVSDDYYPAMKSSTVTLETDAIDRVTPTGIVTKTGTCYDFDLLVLATGFRTTQFMYPIHLYGAGGVSLAETWAREGASAYLGITVSTLPNFGMLYGPNTNLAHNSLILQIEAQSLYINTLISSVLQSKRRGQTLRLEPKASVLEAYNQDVQSKLSKSTFADPNCTSWFKDEKGRITTNWCGSAISYQQRTSFVDWADFEILGTAKREVEGRGRTKWKRVVEETQVSNAMVAVCGGVAVVGAVVAGLWGSLLVR